jgi:hypothetical protein
MACSFLEAQTHCTRTDRFVGDSIVGAAADSSRTKAE